MLTWTDDFVIWLCSDIRGVAVAGVVGELVNLTEPVSEAIGAAFAAWLLERKKPNESRQLRVSIGHDSRISAQKLQVINTMIWLDMILVLDF